jgi:biopolymer transport protein ExbD
MIKFPRKHEIFRGQFQAGPFAAVFLLLLIFLLFHTSLVYVPGLPVQLDQLNLKPNQAKTVSIDASQNYRFNRETFKNLEAFAKSLRSEVSTNAALRLLRIQASPAVTNEVVRRVVDLARDLNLAVDLPGGRIDLPMADGLMIATNQMISVAINLSGQIYFQNQVVPPDRLVAELTEAVRNAGQPLTLLILADKDVEYNLIIRTGAAARAAGIEQVLLAVRPPLFGGGS